MRIANLFLAALISLAATEPGSSSQVPYPGEGKAILPPRLALVIGIENYGDVGGDIALGTLKGATQDAKDVADILPKYGFEDVKLLIRTDDQPLIDKKTIQAEIKDFKERAKQAKEASHRAPVLLFYFAGHGFSADGGSYLIPSNFFADDLYSFEANAISVLHDVVQKLELDFHPALQIIITDSCRTSKPVNIPSISGQLIGNPGSADPNRGRIRPAQAEFGKDRSVFLFSTLDGDPAYEDDGTTGSLGGRFTKAIVSELKDALNAAKPPPAAPITLDTIYDAANQDLDAERSNRWQRAAYDKNWGAPFLLLPFRETYDLERSLFSTLKLTTPDPGPALVRYSCSLRSMLKTVSEFSYYSQQIIDTMQGLPSCQPLPPLGGGPAGVADPPTRDNSAKWSIPSLSAPPVSAPVRSDTENRQPDRRGVLFQVPTNAVFLNAFAQAGNNPSNAPLPSGSSGLSTIQESKPNFGDVRSAVERQATQGTAADAGQLPPSNVPIDQAVVAKIDLNLRKLPDPRSPVTTSIPGGQLLQVLGTTPGRTWLLVKHGKLGSGYVSGDLVEPALMTFDKFITFDAQKYELTETIKQDLATTFTLLGGVAIVDGYVEYPETSNIVDLTRASLTAKYISELATQADSSKKSRLYISIRPASNTASAVKPDTVHVVLLALPLDPETRARLAQSGASVTLEQVVVGTPVSPTDPACCADPPPSGSRPIVQLRYCSPDGKNCYLSNGNPETGQLVEKAVKDTASPDKSARDAGKAIGKSIQDLGGFVGSFSKASVFKF
jgi:caspase domain-containing protein/SH3 domain-containing protein